jgi:glycine cleavage system aminomethyltransferase T
MTDTLTLPALAINAAEVIAAIEAQARRTITPEQVRNEVARLSLDGPNSRAWVAYVDALQTIPWASKD